MAWPTVTMTPSQTWVRVCCESALRRISRTMSSAVRSRAPGMSRPPAGMVGMLSAWRSMSLMM